MRWFILEFYGTPRSASGQGESALVRMAETFRPDLSDSGRDEKFSAIHPMELWSKGCWPFPSDPRGPPTTVDWEAETFCPGRSATAEISRLLERTLLGRHVIRQHSTFSWLLMVVLSWCHVRSLLAILELKTGSHPPLPWSPSACCCACQSTRKD